MKALLNLLAWSGLCVKCGKIQCQCGWYDEPGGEP
jgi:hypothetical protein